MLQREKGWNTAELAKRADISPSTLSALFQRNHQPTIATLQSLCNAFGITVSKFFMDSHLPLDLTPEQAHLLENWNGLTDSQKAATLALIKSIVEG
jgi:transcriptional regulator with XRE-family HTH domain